MRTVHTDGACSRNGNGGWAWAVSKDFWMAGYATDTTNQRMELTASYEAMRSLTGELLIISDSSYVVNCFVKGWYKTWHRNGWKNSQRKPISNRDIFEPFIEAYLARDGEVTFEWVRGHNGDVMNEFVDGLAVDAKIAQQDAWEIP